MAAKRPRQEMEITSTDMLLQQGLHVRKPLQTGNFFRHIYINSNARSNPTALSSNVECILSTPINIPEDGTTTIRLHRASIPWTFNNIRIDAKLTLYNRQPTGSIQDTWNVSIPAGYYDSLAVQTLIIGQLVNTQVTFALTATGRAQFTLTSIAGHYLDIECRGTALTIGPTSEQLTKTAYNIFGFDGPTKSAVIAPNSTTTVLVSPYLFSPIRDTEIQVRLDGVPIDPNVIDMVAGGTPSNIIAILPIDVSSKGDTITAERQNQLQIPIAQRSKIYKLRAYLTFADQEPINLNGTEWGAVFSIEKVNGSS